VHELDRRILATMSELGAVPGRRRLVCRRIVRAVGGEPEVVYEALVRMAQGWVLRYPLIDGAGNFGSVDGDPAADMEYTEARLNELAVEAVGAASVPDRLINGGDGVLPHNLREVAAAVVAFLDDPAIGPGGLAAHIPGPDFPGGGLIVAGADGQTVRVRARLHREGDAIVVTELPFTVEKGGDDGVIVAIAELAMGRRVDLRDLRDESDRKGMRIVIVPGDGSDPERVLAALLEHTPLELELPAGFSVRELVAQYVQERRAAGAGDEEIRRQILELAARHGDERRTAIDLRP
jgi:DNA gyrase subunit A